MATYIVGAGGIGCAIASLLDEPVFVERDTAKVEWGRRHGVTVDGVTDQFPILHFDEWQPTRWDCVFLCVKCYDNAAVLAKLPPEVELIPVQNGYDPALEEHKHAREGIASFVALCEPETMRVRITRPGDLHLVPWRPSEKGSYPPFRHGKITLRYVPDIRPFKATKLMYNAAISPLAAAAGLDNGELLTDAVARSLFFALLKENYSILRSQPLGTVGPFHPRTVNVILRTPGLARLMSTFFVRSLRGTYCSMAGEIGRRNELENYTGHLLRLKPDAPCNRAVMETVSAMTKPDRGVLATLQRQFVECPEGDRP